MFKGQLFSGVCKFIDRATSFCGCGVSVHFDFLAGQEDHPMAYLVGDFGNNILPPSGTVIDGEPENFLFGDTDGTLFPPNAGGNDTLTGGAFSSFNFLFGDADVIKNGAAGGDDFLTGGVNATSNELYGDADLMKNGAVGGDDSLTGGSD
jgi:hypothetical protein